MYQALETELGGVQVDTTAVQCAINQDLKEEWEKVSGTNPKSRQDCQRRDGSAGSGHTNRDTWTQSGAPYW